MSDFAVTCEWIGEYYDDVLVYFDYHKREVAAIRGLLSRAGHYSPGVKLRPETGRPGGSFRTSEDRDARPKCWCTVSFCA